MKLIDAFITKEKSTFNQLRRKIADLNSLTQQVHDCLPAEWCEYCQVVRLDEQQKILVLSTSEQSLVTSLRYMQQQLLSQLKKKSMRFKSIEKINSIYTPSSKVPKHPARQALSSNNAAQACKLAAEQCPASLRGALERLSDTLAKKGS
jgi:hypothetical protein